MMPLGRVQLHHVAQHASIEDKCRNLRCRAALARTACWLGLGMLRFMDWVRFEIFARPHLNWQPPAAACARLVQRKGNGELQEAGRLHVIQLGDGHGASARFATTGTPARP